VVDGSGNPFPAGTFRAGKPTITITIASSFFPPEYAADVQILRTTNNTYGRYLQWAANSVQYISSLASETQPEIATFYQNGNATAIKISLANIVDYARQNSDSLVGYSFLQGDRLRLLYDNDLVLINGFYDFEVTQYDATTQSIYLKAEDVPFEIKAAYVFEIFNPKSFTTEDVQRFYEIGEVIPCTAPNTTGNDFSIRTITLTEGDTYWYGRDIPVNDDINNFSAIIPVVIESASVSDFYPSEAQDIGRVGIVDANFKQIFRPTLMKFSNQFQAGSASNGLSSFEPLNEKELDRAYGQINRFVYTNNNLIVIASTREISNYIGQVTLQQASTGAQGGLVAVSDNFLGTDYVHSRQLGTDFAGSVIPYNGIIFGLANYMGSAWRYQGDGEMSISDMKMLNKFQEWSSSGLSDAIAVYDRRYEEMIIQGYRKRSAVFAINNIIQNGTTTDITLIGALPAPEVNSDATIQLKTIGGDWVSYTGAVVGIGVTDRVDVLLRVTTSDVLSPLLFESNATLTYSLPETLRWFDGTDANKNKKWVSFDSRTPENWCALGSELFTIRNGEIWIEDKNDLYNNFYGVQYNSIITPVFNDQPEDVKIWLALRLMQQQANGQCAWFSDLVTNSLGQLSRLKAANFERKEKHWYTPYLRDLTDTASPAPVILQGRVLRDTDLKVELTNDFSGEIILYGWASNYILSMRTP
jgi:hypothetical protein